MSKKVLGFKGEDIFVFEKNGKKHILVERIGDETIQGNLAFELVPVVSLKWLKKWCKENGYHHMEDETGCIFKHTGKKQDDLVLISELLSSAIAKAKEGK